MPDASQPETQASAAPAAAPAEGTDTQTPQQAPPQNPGSPVTQAPVTQAQTPQQQQQQQQENAYVIRPNFKHKFKPATVGEKVREIMAERLTGVQYHPDECAKLTKELSDEVRNKVSGKKRPYKERH